jgi:hypothetical protein
MTWDRSCPDDGGDGFRVAEVLMSKIMPVVIVRVGGIATAAAGVLVVGQEVWGVVVGDFGEGAVESAVHSTWVLLLVFGLLGVHLHQQHAAGVFGQVATLVALLGTVTLFAASLTEVTILPALPQGSPLIDDPPPALAAVFLVSFVAYVAGLLLFGAAIWRAGVLPRRAAALLVVGVVLALVLKGVVPGVLAVLGVALIWLGVATLAQARTVAADAGGTAPLRT